MTDLGTLGGNSRAQAINDRGDIAGFSDDTSGRSYAVLWRHGRLTDLGTLPGGYHSYATGINSRGEVVGYSTYGGGENLHAFIWRNGRMTDLGSLPGQGYSVALGVNDAGTVVGVATYDGMNTTPVLWQRGRIRDMGLPLGRSGAASAVNNKGEVVGYGNGAFLWRNGRYTDVAADVRAQIPRVTFSQAQAIDSRTQVAGYTDYAAFLWDAGHVTKLPALVSTAAAYGMNDRGQVVGAAATLPDGTGRHATLWVR